MSKTLGHKVFSLRNLGNLAPLLAKGVLEGAKEITDMVQEHVVPLVLPSGDSDDGAPRSDNPRQRKRKLRRPQQKRVPDHAFRRPSSRRVRKKKPKQELRNLDVYEDRIKNHRTQFFSAAMDEYMKQLDILAEGTKTTLKVEEHEKKVPKKMKGLKKRGQHKRQDYPDYSYEEYTDYYYY